MAMTEHEGLQIYKDASGNSFILYPITKARLVDGLEEFVDDKVSIPLGHVSAKNNPHDVTAEQLGIDLTQLNAASVVPGGYGALVLNCVDENGAPVSGCVVRIGEELAVTGVNGVAKFFLTPGSYSVTIVSPIDYGAEAQTKSVTVALSEAVYIEAIIQDSLGGATEADITGSVTAAFSDRVVSADAFGVGGGGSGGCAVNTSSSQFGASAAGGAGGKTKTVKNLNPMDLFVVTIGTGGVARTFSSTNAQNGAAGGTTEIKTSAGIVVLSAPGGEGGKGGITSSILGVSGAAGGSGSGGAVGRYEGSGINAGESGEDGASGKSVAYSPNTYAGGAGQGTTTRAFGEENGELFASAGASVGAYSSLTPALGTPGEGAGHAAGGALAKNGSAIAGNGETPGSGGGAVAVVNASNVYSTLTVKSGAGANGLVRFRWEVSA